MKKALIILFAIHSCAMGMGEHPENQLRQRKSREELIRSGELEKPTVRTMSPKFDMIKACDPDEISCERVCCFGIACCCSCGCIPLIKLIKKCCEVRDNL